MSARPSARVLPHRPRKSDTGVLLTARIGGFGRCNQAELMAAITRGDADAMELIGYPKAQQFRYPVLPSAWTARDVRRVATIMGSMIRPVGTEIFALTWNSDGLEFHVRSAPANGEDVCLRTPSVPLSAMMELTAGQVDGLEAEWVADADQCGRRACS